MPGTITPTALPDVLLLQPKVIGDDRGFFFESFRNATSNRLRAWTCTSFKTTTTNPAKGGCLACITKFSTRKANWFESLKVQCLI